MLFMYRYVVFPAQFFVVSGFGKVFIYVNWKTIQNRSWDGLRRSVTLGDALCVHVHVMENPLSPSRREHIRSGGVSTSFLGLSVVKNGMRVTATDIAKYQQGHVYLLAHEFVNLHTIPVLYYVSCTACINSIH